MSYQQRRGDSEGKFFVGNLSWDTTSEVLSEYFSKYGEVTDAVVITDRGTGRSRGFGFVTFRNSEDKHEVFKSDHTIDNRQIFKDNNYNNSHMSYLALTS